MFLSLFLHYLENCTWFCLARIDYRQCLCIHSSHVSRWSTQFQIVRVPCKIHGWNIPPTKKILFFMEPIMLFFKLVIQFLSYTLSHPNEKHSYSMFNGKKSHFLFWSKHNTVYFVPEQKLLSILNKKCKQNNTKLCFQTKNCAAFVLLPLLLLLEYCCICTGNVSSRMWF